VRISGCTITVRDANDLAAASQIESLRLSCPIEPGAFAPLARLPRLASIYVQGKRFEPSDLRDLRASRSLKELFIGDAISDDGRVLEGLVEAISEISSLERVSMYVFVTAEELEPLTRLPNLRSLAIGGVDVSPGLVPIFKRMSRLEELTIIEAFGAARAMNQLSKAIPSLRILFGRGGGARSVKSKP
jgi:hypothetical protein